MLESSQLSVIFTPEASMPVSVCLSLSQNKNKSFKKDLIEIDNNIGCIFAILEPWRMRQEDFGFKARLGNIVRTCLKINKDKNKSNNNNNNNELYRMANINKFPWP